MSTFLSIGEVKMVFSEEVKTKAFERENGCCQLCGKKLVFKNRGNSGGRGAWEAHHKKPVSEGGSDLLRNCMILCIECHRKPQTLIKKENSSSPFNLNFGKMI